MINGSTLSALRLSAGLSKNGLAEHLGAGYSDATVRAIESGRRKIGLVMLQKWATACGFDVEIKFSKNRPG